MFAVEEPRAVDRSSADWPVPRERCGFAMGIDACRLCGDVFGRPTRI